MRHIVKETIAKLIAKTTGILPDLELHIVTNIEGQTNTRVLDVDFGLKSRFYLFEEIDEAVQAWQGCGASVFVHRSEEQFISEIDRIGKETAKKVVIYGMADSSTGPGRKSLIPALCHLYGLTYLNSDAFSNAFARHKYLSNIVVRAHGIQAPETWFFRPGAGWLEGRQPPTGVTVLAKPSYDCQSIGISIKSKLVIGENSDHALETLAHKLDQPLTVQEFIQGYELSVPLLTCPDLVSPGVVALAYEGNLNWGPHFRMNADLYSPGKITKVPFDNLGSDFNDRLIEEAKSVYNIIGFCGTAKIDFRVKENGDFYVMDINESPSPIRLDQFYIAMDAAGFSFRDMLVAFVGSSLSVRPGFKDLK